MIFKGTWEKVLDGTKTQTRRPVKTKKNQKEQSMMYLSETGEIIKVMHLIKIANEQYKERLLYEVGRTYAVQPGRGKKSLGKIKTMEIRIEKVQAISCIDMIAEGLKTNLRHIDATMHLLDQWRDLWNSLYEGTPYSWGKNPDVWVLEFELVEKY